MVLALGVSLQVGPVKVDLPQVARAVSLRFIVEVRGCRMAALAARCDRPGANLSRRIQPRRRSCFRWCRTISLSRGYGRAPNEASEPHTEDVKPTGMLGFASLNGCTMSPVRRWNRLISPQGVFQVPKSASSLSDAAESDCSNCSPGTLPAM